MPAAQQPASRLLTLNTGSSSLKAALYGASPDAPPELRATAERIGREGGKLTITDAEGAILFEIQRELPDHDAAVQALLAWLHTQHGAGAFGAVGHRIVHGGSDHREPERVTPALLTALKRLVPIDPDHLPQAIGAIEAVTHAAPQMPQVACFDTAFHRHMPPVARRYALPREYEAAGVVRFGFHGLSYEYIMDALHTESPAAARGRVVIAHLGNGASMVAVRDGIGIETTMGFTPTGGLVMGTRTGDLDPGVLLYLLHERGMTADAISTLVNKEGGMLGVSGTSGDMRDLLDREAADPHAADAVALFCYTAKKHLGALVAALGGLDTLIFTGGIGEHAAPVRERICAGLAFLGITLDPHRNATGAAIISPDDTPVVVRVMPTDEDAMIARHTRDVLIHGGTHVRI